MKYLVIIFPLLTACASANTCLPLKHWTNTQQDQMEAQLDMLPPNSPLVDAMVDYAKMRKETMACIGATQ